MTSFGVFFIILSVVFCIFICLEYFEKETYRKQLEESDQIIHDLIRIMGVASYEEFCNYCGGKYKYYFFKPRKIKYYIDDDKK